MKDMKITILVSVLISLVFLVPDRIQLWAYQTVLVQQDEWWRFFTAVFVHLDLLHLVRNLGIFLIVGSSLERKLGSLQYIMLILVSGIMNNVFAWLSGIPDPFIGLSGVIFAIIIVLFLELLVKERSEASMLGILMVLIFIDQRIYHVSGVISGIGFFYIKQTFNFLKIHIKGMIHVRTKKGRSISA